MKRLLNSSRFWATVIGFGTSWLSYKSFDDATYALAVLGAFTAVVVTGASKDMMKTYKAK